MSAGQPGSAATSVRYRAGRQAGAVMSAVDEVRANLISFVHMICTIKYDAATLLADLTAPMAEKGSQRR
jgi:hypothetical protein